MAYVRANMGISTLIIFIVIVLIATVAAVVLLNAANSLKNQAQITQRESQAKFSKRLEIVYVFGIVDRNSVEPVIRYLRITVRVPPAGDYVDLRNTVLQFSTEDEVATASFIDYDGDNESVGDPCDRTDDRVLAMITNGWKEMELNEVYNAFHLGQLYTVSWALCGNKRDSRMIFPGQIANIYYAPPNGLYPGDHASIALIVNDGGSTEVEFTVPDILTGTIVRLYPP